ncbi:hypothetical protein DFA_08872 [Cavenderia fasciculata]|uniref:Single domain-containing protein n=1 Tax=Cavenderia fasciculata TaxID=261658 RepID=F4Q4S5_CACFS|nr:uncharacterized protein DFA_08872 [Cavenderia fasciculata]EGG17871.1 hypothetical protein DFA_08872 [Cavenderia fasciculata]|eukprot:XP_004356355.1 hypothetical protein DFA_08872 [Cavenderia fasciculata]
MNFNFILVIVCLSIITAMCSITVLANQDVYQTQDIQFPRCTRLNDDGSISQCLQFKLRPGCVLVPGTVWADYPICCPKPHCTPILP